MSSSTHDWTNPLLGYAVRDLSPAATQAWDDEERRSIYLFRLDAARILTVDDMAWPSVLSDEQQLIVDSRGNFYLRDLCPDLENLRERLRSIWGGNWPPCLLVAVNLLTDGWGEAEHAEWRDWAHYWAEVMPRSLDPSWRLLGYDVACSGFFSALCNCGLKPEEMKAARGKWAPLLNSDNLFEDKAVAWEFKRFYDERIPEHAPFFIYGLWQIPAADLPK